MKSTLIAILLASLTSVDCTAADAQFSDILGECWKGNDHPRMSACVKTRAAEARRNLKSIVSQLRQGIAKSEEGAGYSKSAALAALDASIKSFQEYRTRECALVYAIASMGQGAEDNKLACEAQLDFERSVQLKATSWWVEDASSPNTSLERTRER
jgi:uncharacterized protein YecT (DUF1311 family)